MDHFLPLLVTDLFRSNAAVKLEKVWRLRDKP